MTVEATRPDDGVVTVALSGEIDVHTADKVRSALLTALDTPGVVRLVVDMSDVAFLDSTALGALIAARTHADQVGATLAIVHANHRVRRILEVTRLGAVLGDGG